VDRAATRRAGQANPNDGALVLGGVGSGGDHDGAYEDDGGDDAKADCDRVGESGDGLRVDCGAQFARGAECLRSGLRAAVQLDWHSAGEPRLHAVDRVESSTAVHPLADAIVGGLEASSVISAMPRVAPRRNAASTTGAPARWVQSVSNWSCRRRSSGVWR